MHLCVRGERRRSLSQDLLIYSSECATVCDFQVCQLLIFSSLLHLFVSGGTDSTIYDANNDDMVKDELEATHTHEK